MPHAFQAVSQQLDDQLFLEFALWRGQTNLSDFRCELNLSNYCGMCRVFAQWITNAYMTSGGSLWLVYNAQV